MTKYYIVSLKWTYPNSQAFTLWRRNSNGYCWYREWAGIYTEKDKENREHSEGHLRFIDIEVAELLFRTALYDRQYVTILPNNNHTRKIMGIKKKELLGGMSDIQGATIFEDYRPVHTRG